MRGRKKKKFHRRNYLYTLLFPGKKSITPGVWKKGVYITTVSRIDKYRSFLLESKQT